MGDDEGDDEGVDGWEVGGDSNEEAELAEEDEPGEDWLATTTGAVGAPFPRLVRAFTGSFASHSSHQPRKGLLSRVHFEQVLSMVSMVGRWMFELKFK